MKIGYLSGAFAVVYGIGMCFGAISDVHAADANYGQSVTCEPYNSQWQLCTRRTWMPDGTYEEEQFFAPYPDQYDSIDP